MGSNRQRSNKVADDAFRIYEWEFIHNDAYKPHNDHSDVQYHNDARHLLPLTYLCFVFRMC